MRKATTVNMSRTLHGQPAINPGCPFINRGNATNSSHKPILNSVIRLRAPSPTNARCRPCSSVPPAAQRGTSLWTSQCACHPTLHPVPVSSSFADKSTYGIIFVLDYVTRTAIGLNLLNKLTTNAVIVYGGFRPRTRYAPMQPHRR